MLFLHIFRLYKPRIRDVGEENPHRHLRSQHYSVDCCAAPGGKSTQIGAKLNGTGLLWSNEIVRSRANILLSNIERMGISNAVVSNCRPDELCKRLENRFDRILVSGLYLISGLRPITPNPEHGTSHSTRSAPAYFSGSFEASAHTVSMQVIPRRAALFLISSVLCG